MNWHPFLTWIETTLFRALIRSPRIGMIIVKQHGEMVTWVLRDPTDDADPFEYDDSDNVPGYYETPVQQLERLYHAPDADPR